MRLSERAKQLKTDVPALFLALKHPKTPFYAKALATLTVVYALSPIDLVPDFIPLLGYLDDVLLLPCMIALTIRLIPSPIWTECRAQAHTIWQSGKPKKWYYAIPILVIWLLLIALVIHGLVHLLSE